MRAHDLKPISTEPNRKVIMVKPVSEAALRGLVPDTGACGRSPDGGRRPPSAPARKHVPERAIEPPEKGTARTWTR